MNRGEVTIGLWKGKKIEGLGKKQLLKIVEWMGGEIERMKPKSDWYDEHKLDLIENRLID